jgi:ankyrin repeat protein
MMMVGVLYARLHGVVTVLLAIAVITSWEFPSYDALCKTVLPLLSTWFTDISITGSISFVFSSIILDGRTALIAAAYMGHAEIVQDLLNYNADVNHQDKDGRTALSVAALCIRTSEGHEKVVGLLLENGAEVNHQDHDGMTPSCTISA